MALDGSSRILLIRSGALYLPATPLDLERFRHATGKVNMFEHEHDEMFFDVAAAGYWIETAEHPLPVVPETARLVEIRHDQNDHWFLAHRSTRLGVRYQLTEFLGQIPVGHTDWDSLLDAVCSACGLRRRALDLPVGSTRFRVTSWRL